MSLFDGPFGTSANYLTMIALPNCVEYFGELEQPNPGIVRREQARRLFNAVVALDAAVEYVYHAENRAISMTASAFIKSLGSEVERLRDVANALKHCVRGNDRTVPFRRDDAKTHAHGYATTNLSVSVDLSAGHVQVTGDTVLDDAHAALLAAWQYWVRRVQAA